MLTTKKWNLAGGLTYFHEINDFLSSVESFYNLPGKFIDAVFDSHAGLPWNGGRFVDPFHFTVEESVRRIRAYNERGIRFNITFSNRLLTKEDLAHEDCNWFLSQCHSSMNGVIVASDILRQYLRSCYPKYRVIASIGFDRTDLEYYREAQKLYDTVVLHPDLNRDYDLIKHLDASRLEVLVNEFCVANCPFRTEHSTYISEIALANRTYFMYDNEHTRGSCLAVERGYRRNKELVVTPQELNRLHKMGITQFKIQGREHPFDAAIYPALREYTIKDTIRTICGTNR
ncbi:MAG: hypothetical protein HYX92_22120 [Chloroflexi bacterium]|nr:hypothetical protein [Chloroflexota bacterium]